MEKDFIVVGAAENGVESLNLCGADLKVHIIISDLNMKVMDGLELTRYI